MTKDHRIAITLAVCTGLALLGYLTASDSLYRTGFPLDDAWIHQVYARNLALRQEWAFTPGQPSAGSTAPLWTLLLAPGFFLPLAPYLWTFGLGAALLFGSALLVEKTIRALTPAYQPGLPWAGIFFLLEWRITWAAVSGMETSLYILLTCAALGLMMREKRLYAPLGVLCGLGLWVRPDALTLLGPITLYALLAEPGGRAKWRALLGLVVGFGTFAIPYLAFNLALSGQPLPNTFYAKQQEYASWQALPMLERLGSSGLVFLAGPGLALAWSFAQKVYQQVRARRWGIPLAAAWALGYFGLYALRLPPYQHGRYLMPAIAIYVLVGLAGFCENLPAPRTYRSRLLRQAGLTLLAALTLAFSGFGATAFARDVAFIESEMVDSALWAAQNLPPGALVAAHDIGALGYFGRQPILDLAGLVSPGVIPILRNEERLAAYMTSSGVEYLAVFPGWYSSLPGYGKSIYATGGQFSQDPATGNLTIYRWGGPDRP